MFDLISVKCLAITVLILNGHLIPYQQKYVNQTTEDDDDDDYDDDEDEYDNC